MVSCGIIYSGLEVKKMRRIVKGEFVKMTEAEILEDLDDEIKDYAGIDVQILHRFEFLPKLDDENRTYIEVFDRYKEEPLLNKNFGDLGAAFHYLRSRYKKEPGIEYEVIERKVSSRTKPEPAERKKKVDPVVKDTVEEALHDIGEIVDMSTMRVKDRDKFIKEFRKELRDLEHIKSYLDGGDEE
jgi:hypothetical protein